MVETRQTSKFENLVKDRKLLVVIVILPSFKLYELVRFCRLNKACYEIIENKVNYEVLLETQGIKKKINPFILAAFKSGPFTSKLNGLKELAKHLLIKTISRSEQIGEFIPFGTTVKTTRIPNFRTLACKSLEQLRSLSIQ